MATTSDSTWMPSPGPHPVSVGSSLSKALKARRGTAAPVKRSNLPDREFYSFRYNFKPESIDPTKPGSIEVRKGAESTSVTVERASTQQGEGQLFQGNEHAAREWECVLIYDEELGTFTLEKLDSYVVLQYDRKTVMQSNRPPESPNPTPSGPIPSITSVARDLDFEAQLERDLLGMEDAEGEPDDEFEEILPTSSTTQALKQEEEEASENERQIPKPTAEPAPSRPTNPKPSVTAASRAKASTIGPSALPKQNNAAIEKAKGKGAKRAREQVINPDEEDLEFGKPARAAKHPRPSPPPAPPGLALPTGQTMVPKSLALPLGGGSSQTSIPSQPLPDISDSEDEWDEVPAELASNAGVTITLTTEDLGRMARANESEEEEIDENALEAELNEQLREDDDEDFLARAVSPEPEHSTDIPIMSLNQYAGGDMFGDDDYSSSSEESDD